MSKSVKTQVRKTTVKVGGAAVKATPVRRRKAVIAAPAVVAEVSMADATVVEASVAAPAVEPLFFIPDLGVSDLVMGPQGFHQLPGKTWHRLSGRFGKVAVRQAIAVMIALPELRLPLALELATWPSFRPHMIAQLAAVAANQDVKIVLEWVWNHQGFTWREAYTAFPRAGFAGCKATREEIGKFNKLVSLLDSLRKEGKTSIRALDFLAQAAHLIGWIK